MTAEGTIVRARELGKNGYDKYIWANCTQCEMPRWVVIRRGEPFYESCKKCGDVRKGIKRRIKFQGKGNPNWKDTFRYQRPGGGYVEIILNPDDFFFPMTNKKRHVNEHRLVMAKHLGRNLHSWEVVHHINRIKDDNRIENLQLVNDLGHKQLTLLERKIDTQAETIDGLRKENRLLRWQLKETLTTTSWR